MRTRTFYTIVLSICQIAVSTGGNCVHGQETSQTKSTPNIVLIMADDLGWKDLHCYGNENVDTPNLDRLAKQGLLFTDAYSAASVCTPTRAALMTGESPARLNITNHAGGHPPNFQKPGTNLVTPLWLRHLPLERITIAEQLKQAGYATGFVGKWHLSHRSRSDEGEDLPSEPELRAEHQGFDINIGGCRFGGPPSYFSPYKIPNLDGKFDGEYLPDRCADECIDFIKSAKAENDRPFFLCWWNYSVHYPFQAPDDLIAKYEKRKGPGVENPTYAAMIEGMDASIGKLLKSIDDQGLSEDTLVIFTSDNGPFAANVKPLRAEKGYLYEGGIRVPMIVRWPGRVRPASQTATPVITMDIHASILEAANLKADPSNTPDGVSLLPMLKEESQLKRKSIFFHYPNYAFHKKNRMASAIRSGEYKLIKFYDDESVELYNLKDDIGEANDLSKSMPEMTQQLQSELESWLEETKASQPQHADADSNGFPGDKVDFNGFDRYTFKVNDVQLSVVCPQKAAPGKPWLWRSMFWGGTKDATRRVTLMDLELVKQGYHVVIRPGDASGHPRGNASIDVAWDYLTKQHGFARKVSMGSMSRETLALFRWASSNPDKVASIYVDNGVCSVKSWPGGRLVPGTGSSADGAPKSWELLKKTYGFASNEEALAAKVSPIDWLDPLAKAGVPILLCSGTKDSTVPYEENAAILMKRYKELGGNVKVILEEKDHHPHGLENSAPVIEFIKKNNPTNQMQ